jgi:hypothetical protein
MATHFPTSAVKASRQTCSDVRIKFDTPCSRTATLSCFLSLQKDGFHWLIVVAYPLRLERAMNRKLSWRLAVLLLASGNRVEAQPAGKIHRIGFLSGSFPGPSFGIQSIQRELRNLGYVEGKNIAFEYRYAEDKPERSPTLADELVRLKVDVIIAGGSSDTQAARKLPRQFLSFFWSPFPTL